MRRESPGAQMVPSGVLIQNPQQSSGAKMRSLAPGDAFCQAWSAGVTSTRTGPIWKASPMSWPAPAGPPAAISEATYCVEWNVPVTSARSRQVGTL